MADAAPHAADAAADERLRRWRLVLGAEADAPLGVTLSAEAQAMDRALAALYGDAADEPERRAGLGASSPDVARWLGDIRTYFPAAVVRVMQRDAFDRLGLRRMLLEPELLAAVEPDVHLVATLLSLGGVLPARTRETARVVVRRVVDDLERRLASPLRQAVTGALNRATRTRRPRAADIDWHRTIRANLRHYQPEQRTIVPESLVGHTRRQSTLRDVILLVDQSGSMASSVVYSGVLGAALASLRAVRTSMVVVRHGGRRPHRGSSPTRSSCCSACSSAAAPTSTGPSPTRRGSCARRTRRSSCSSRTCTRAGTATRCSSAPRRSSGAGVQVVALLALSDARRTVVRPAHGGRPRRARRARASPARPTRSPSSWLRRSNAWTSAPGQPRGASRSPGRRRVPDTRLRLRSARGACERTQPARLGHGALASAGGQREPCGSTVGMRWHVAPRAPCRPAGWGVELQRRAGAPLGARARRDWPAGARSHIVRASARRPRAAVPELAIMPPPPTHRATRGSLGHRPHHRGASRGGSAAATGQSGR
jgi:hypothetical protein